MFFLAWFLGPHFSHFFEIWCQNDDFGTPLAANCDQSGTQNLPNGAQKQPKSISRAHFLGFRRQLARRKGTRGVPRSFFMEFAWILTPFFMILDPYNFFLSFWQGAAIEFWDAPNISYDFGKVSVSMFQSFRESPRTVKDQHRARHKTNSSKHDPPNCNSIMPSTANERFPQTALAQNGGRRCHAAWRIQ